MMNWKGCGRKHSWPILVLSQHLPGTSKEHYKSNQESWFLGPDFNLRLSEYEAGLLSLYQCLVRCVCVVDL
jgi:hypothetical protein